MRRYKMKTSKSKKLFKKTANGSHKKNYSDRTIMRGGYRL